MNCKVCNKHYHWCNNCGCYGLWDNLMSDGFCSKNCWEQSEDYKRVLEAVLKVYSACKSHGVEGELFQIVCEESECSVDYIISEIWKKQINSQQGA